MATTIASLRERIYEILCDGSGVVRALAPAHRFQRLTTTRGARDALSVRAGERPIVHVSIRGDADIDGIAELTDDHLYRLQVRITRYYHIAYDSDPESVDATLDRAFDDRCRTRAALGHPANLVQTEAGKPTGIAGSSLRLRGISEGDNPDDALSGADRLHVEIDVYEAAFSFSPDA